MVAVAIRRCLHKLAAMNAPAHRSISRVADLGRNMALAIACTATAACTTTPSNPLAALPDPLAAGWQGKPVCEKLHDDAQQHILRCTFAPGVGHERHYHAPHFGYALVGGKARIIDASGTREVSFATGSSSAKADASWHEIVNIGDTTIVYLIVEPK